MILGVQQDWFYDKNQFGHSFYPFQKHLSPLWGKIGPNSILLIKIFRFRYFYTWYPNFDDAWQF